MNFYNISASVPISSLLNAMTIDNKLYQDLSIYYLDINLKINLDYHDYNLSLYLFSKNYNIIYYNIVPMGHIKYSDLHEDPICDYKKTWVQRYSGYYGNFFYMIKTFLDCNACNFGQKIILFFHIIGLLIEFIFPSLSTMVVYTIFYETFNINDIRPAAFCTLLYLFILLCSGACSLISKNIQRMRLTNLFFFIFMEVYYLFILICSVVAMDNIKKNKNNNAYKFNKAAISFIIIFPSIIPMLLKFKIIFENFVIMLLYIILGSPSSSSNFYIAKILSACEASGGSNTKERKGIFIIAYILINLFFGSLTLFNYNRKKRVESVKGFGIFYLIYNFFKILAIVISITNGNKNAYIAIGVTEDIKNGSSQINENYNNNFNNNYNNDAAGNVRNVACPENFLFK